MAHRDIKPFNIFVSNGEIRLIDFGSAAAMGIRERVGYDYNKSPCDPRYAPPEQFIDEADWAKYDVYCVGLILVCIYMYTSTHTKKKIWAKYDVYCVGLILVCIYMYTSTHTSTHKSTHVYVFTRVYICMSIYM